MNARRSRAGRRSCLLLISALLAACHQDRSGDRKGESPDRLAELAANSSFSVSEATAQPVLAIQVRYTQAGASVVRSEFLAAPLPTGSGEQDFMVIGLSGTRVAHKYAIPDPLEAEVETEDRGEHRTIRLPEALVWIYMPAVAIDTVELSPTREDNLPEEGVRIDMRPVLRRLCGDSEVPICAARAVAAAAAESGPVPDRR